MKPPIILQYHHVRADLSGMAVVIACVGLALLAIVLPVLNVALSEEWIRWIEAVAIGAWLVSVLFYWWLGRRVRGQEEMVELDHTGFDSRLFGRIDFSDITRHAEGRDVSLRRKGATAPSLCLRLKSGRRLHFHLDNRYYAEDLLDYLAFIEAVLAGVRGQAQNYFEAGLPGKQQLFGAKTKHAPSLLPRDFVRYMAPNGSTKAKQKPSAMQTPGKGTARQDQNMPSVARQLGEANRQAGVRFKQHLARDHKLYSVAMVLLSLAYLVRACGPEIKSVIAPDPFTRMQQQAPQALERSSSRLQHAVAQKGPVYLWGRDIGSNIKPVLIPNVSTRHQIGITSIDTMNIAGDISRFLRNGEVEGYRIGLRHDGKLTLVNVSNISMQPIPGEKALFFFMLMPEGQARKDAKKSLMSDSAWRIRYHNISDLPARIRQGEIGLPMMLVEHWLKMTPSPRLMVASSEYHGMSDEEFAQVVQVLETSFRQQGVDISHFSTRRFKDGSASE